MRQGGANGGSEHQDGRLSPLAPEQRPTLVRATEQAGEPGRWRQSGPAEPGRLAGVFEGPPQPGRGAGTASTPREERSPSADLDTKVGYQMGQQREQQDSQWERAREVRGSAPPPRAQRDVLNHANFGLLPQEKGRFGTFGVSAGINLVILAIILVLTINRVQEARVHRNETLVYVTPPPVKPYVPPVPTIKMPPVTQLPKEVVKVQPPKPVIEPPKVEPMKVEAKAPAMPAPAPRPVVTPPKPVVGQFAAPAAAQRAVQPAAAKAAGFGSPTGVQANPNATQPSQLAVTGGFGSAANSNTGQTGRPGTVSTTGFGAGSAQGGTTGTGSQPAGMPGGHGTVASTGFGAGSSPGGNGTGTHGTIASTGFGNTPAASTAPVRVQQPVTTSIVVLSKPLPQYTAEAREAHIQGDVTLRVRFTADGQVGVLGVISGLGHGLDEQARLAAAQWLLEQLGCWRWACRLPWLPPLRKKKSLCSLYH